MMSFSFEVHDLNMRLKLRLVDFGTEVEVVTSDIQIELKRRRSNVMING